MSIQFRYFVPRFTLAMMEAGLTPAKMQTGPGRMGMFGPPQLEWRHTQKILVDGQASTEWTSWQAVPWVREGVDDVAAAEPESEPAAAAPAS